MTRLSRPVAALGYVLGALLALSGVVGIAQTAAADVSIDNGQPGMLRLESTELPEWSRQMQPGDVVRWPITTRLEFTESGELTLTIEHSGALAEHPDGLSLLLERCGRPWEGATCPDGAITLVSDRYSAIASGTVLDLGRILPSEGQYFLATLSLPETMPNDLQGATAALAFGFTALGDETTITLPGGLPATGTDPSRFSGALALGAGVLLGGLVLARQRGTPAARGER